MLSGQEQKEEKLRQLGALMRTFFERALDDARRDFQMNGLDVHYARSVNGEILLLERAGIVLSVTLERALPAIVVRVQEKTVAELFYDLERGEIVTGTLRPPNLHAIFSRAMSMMIDEALAEPYV